MSTPGVLAAERFQLSGEENVPSPALLVWPDRVRRNIGRMVEQVGGDLTRLRPHLKTHKMAEVVRLQIDAGIKKFKGATISELAMAAGAGAEDLLFAYQPVGPNIARLAELIRQHPKVAFSALVDDPLALQAIAAGDFDRPLPLLVDVNCGMGRTGIGISRAADLCRSTGETAGVEFAGLQLYDGHVRSPSLDERRSEFEEWNAQVEKLLDEAQPPTVVGGGSPTFALHAECAAWECSPGTTVFWDAGYGESYPDLPFEIAAALLTRVISKPGGDRICLDIGHKAIAAENPLDQRMVLPGISEPVEFVSHSEEHLVIRTPAAGRLEVGDAMVALPRHICPSVALHSEASLVGDDGRVTDGRWKVAARDR